MFYLYKTRRESLKNGFFFGLVITLIFAARFFIEFVKENQVGFEDGMTFNMGQILSLPYLVVGIGFIIFGLIKTKMNTQRPTQQLNPMLHTTGIASPIPKPTHGS